MKEKVHKKDNIAKLLRKGGSIKGTFVQSMRVKPPRPSSRGLGGRGPVKDLSPEPLVCKGASRS